MLDRVSVICPNHLCVSQISWFQFQQFSAHHKPTFPFPHTKHHLTSSHATLSSTRFRCCTFFFSCCVFCVFVAFGCNKVLILYRTHCMTFILPYLSVFIENQFPVPASATALGHLENMHLWFVTWDGKRYSIRLLGIQVLDRSLLPDDKHIHSSVISFIYSFVNYLTVGNTYRSRFRT